MEKAMLAAEDISDQARLTTRGRPWPPNSVAEPSAGQPAATMVA